jgi:cation:H+ antiporter
VVVGLTVVAFGTSAPELVVSLLAAARKSEALAVGNVVGSNIANIGLILGLAALIRPLKAERGLIKREVPMMLAASFLFYGFAWTGMINRYSGGILFAGLLAFLLYSGLTAKEHPEEVQTLEEELEEIQPPISSVAKDWLLLILGLGGLLGGAQLLVGSAVYLARAIGVSEGIIGLTLVAGGTSLPELATSAVAALKKETEISVGNIIGSNLFNILAVVGLVSLVRPLPVEPGWLLFQFPVMLLFSLALLPVMWNYKISRWEGGILLAAYLAFLAWLF